MISATLNHWSTKNFTIEQHLTVFQDTLKILFLAATSTILIVDKNITNSLFSQNLLKIKIDAEFCVKLKWVLFYFTYIFVYIFIYMYVYTNVYTFVYILI